LVGRINRVRFLGALLVTQFLVWLPAMALFACIQFLGGFLPRAVAGSLEIGVVFLALIASYCVFAGPIAQRAHDLGWRAKNVLPLFAVSAFCGAIGLACTMFAIFPSDVVTTIVRLVAAPGQLALILLFVLPGQQSENEFGPAPKPA
jgi:uncharacterized membrane protein YhaH (DUF805 family)